MIWRAAGAATLEKKAYPKALPPGTVAFSDRSSDAQKSWRHQIPIIPLAAEAAMPARRLLPVDGAA